MKVVLKMQFLSAISPRRGSAAIVREEAVASLKKRKSPGIDNIRAELAQCGGEIFYLDL